MQMRALAQRMRNLPPAATSLLRMNLWHIWEGWNVDYLKISSSSRQWWSCGNGWDRWDCSHPKIIYFPWQGYLSYNCSISSWPFLYRYESLWPLLHCWNFILIMITCSVRNKEMSRNFPRRSFEGKSKKRSKYATSLLSQIYSLK